MSFRSFIRRFARDDSGSVTVEMMLILPILIWCFMATYVFFDAYRTQTVNVKAAYTIGDQLSRETGYVTPAYMDSLASLHDFLVNTPEVSSIRITAYEYERDDDSFRVIWSQGRGMVGRVTDAQINDIKASIPEMPDEEIAILVETWVDFDPDNFIGLQPFTNYEVVVNRPRFASQLCWNTLNNGNQTTAVCQAGF